MLTQEKSAADRLDKLLWRREELLEELDAIKQEIAGLRFRGIKSTKRRRADSEDLFENIPI